MTPSKILFYFCFSFIGGIFLNSFFAPHITLLCAGLILGILLISVFWRYKKLVIIGFCILFLALGIWRHQIFLSKLENSEIKKHINENIVLIGVVDAEPDIREKVIKLKIRIEGIDNEILVTARRYPEYQYGDKLKITGRLEEPQIFEEGKEDKSSSSSLAIAREGKEDKSSSSSLAIAREFNYKNYLLKDGILAVINFPEMELIGENFGNPIMKSLFSLKQRLKESLNNVMSPPQSGLLEALFFGDEENIPKDWKEKFNLTSTRHIAAVSGMNITIISALILNFLLFLGFWRPQAFYLSIILIFLYILMIGAPASAVRAGIMGILFLAAQHLGRISTGSRVIVFAATLMLIQNPLLLTLDIGFQLSFLAVMGLIYLQPIFSDFLKKIPDFFLKDLTFEIFQVRVNLSATLAAQIFALPILIYNFGQVSIISPITNILILPLIPIITILGFIFSFIGIFWQGLAQILSWPAWLLLSYILKIIDLSSKIPFSYLIFKNVHWIFLPISYLALGILTWRLQENQKLKFLKY